MRKKIISSILVKGLGAIGSFLIVILTSRYLGAEGRGEVSLFMANLTFVQLFNNIIIGPGMVYLVPRHNTFHLFFISFIWSVLCSSIIIIGLHFTSLSPPNLSLHLWALSILFALFSSNMKIIQGKEFIHFLNSITLLQLSSLLISISVFFILLKEINFYNYLIALYISYTLTFTVSIIKISTLIKQVNLTTLYSEFIIIFKKGFTAQIGNFFNFLNARFAYYLLAFYYADNKSSLGIYSVAVSISESIFIISYGIATVQYPAIANNKNKEYAIETTLKLSKLCFWISFSALSLLLLIPNNVYTLIFGNDFHEIKQNILILSPGIIMMSISNIYWNYFGGTGNFKINNMGEFYGLIGTFCFCFLLIKYFGITGAALSCSITYCITGLYLIIQFLRNTNTPIKDILPSIADYSLLKK